MCEFEQALEVIRKADDLTRGIPKIICLVGWPKSGHDHGYPSRDEVSPSLKRPHDATAPESLRWLIREARQYSTTVSLHIDMTGAYQHSPLWDDYVANDRISRVNVLQAPRPPARLPHVSHRRSFECVRCLPLCWSPVALSPSPTTTTSSC